MARAGGDRAGGGRPGAEAGPGSGASTPAAKTQPRSPQRTHLLTRTSWTDASLAYSQIHKGKAGGKRAALWVRCKLQAYLFQGGCLVQRHAGKVLFVGLLILATFCVGLKSAIITTRVDKLWIPEGGRLERELEYVERTLGEGALSSSQQSVLQKVHPGQSSILHPSALLHHLRVLQVATSVTIDLFDRTWRMKDICSSPGVPNFDAHYIDQIFENIYPCIIMTPLDCFWEGSKLLGPDFPVNIPGIGNSVRWTNLHPQQQLERIKAMDFNFPFSTLQGYMKRGGITSGYQEKPCLDPHDPECPDTAPNKAHGQPPDVGAELTGGCSGFATRFMHRPEELLLGGTTRNRTGHLVRAKAMETTLQLMTHAELHRFWANTWKVDGLDWTLQKAKMVLSSWQDKFTKVVLQEVKNQNGSRWSHIHTFSTSALDSILQDFSEMRVSQLAWGVVLMVLYACVALLRWSDGLRSQSGLGAAGVLLTAAAVAAGLGCCALLGISFNAATTQILPFLALGLGLDNMFLLLHGYTECSGDDFLPFQELTGEVLKRTGSSMLLSAFCTACAFLAAAIIPVPALRAFSLQAAVLTVTNTASMLLIFPAILSLDMRRRRAKRLDILCCFAASNHSGGEGLESVVVTTPTTTTQSQPVGTVVHYTNKPGQVCPVTVVPQGKSSTRSTGFHHHLSGQKSGAASVESLATTASSRDLLKRLEQRGKGWSWCGLECHFKPPQEECARNILSCYFQDYYARFITSPPVKVTTAAVLLLVLAASAWGATKVKEGLNLADLVPQGSNEHEFLEAQEQYFGFYHMYAVTQGNFEYPMNQKLLYQYHRSFVQVDHILKNDDGGLPDFWLSLFRDWLLGLQEAFDRDYALGRITRERWFPNATEEGVLAYKLLVQTGHVDNPVDKARVDTNRLVDSEGVINPKAFYNYLTAWVSNDALAYSASQASLRPEPRSWYHVASDVELKIPKSPAITYAQMPFQLHGLSDTASVKETIAAVRDVCSQFRAQGLPNFPLGLPFSFWEQYVGLWAQLGLALGAALAAAGLATLALLLDPWAAVLVVLSLGGLSLQLLGAMGWLGLKLSAIPAVVLVASIGMGIHSQGLLLVGFVTGVGGRERRVQLAVKHLSPPLVHAALSTMLGVLMLAFTPFDFVFKYFFYVLSASVTVALINGLVFFPVLLSLFGPAAEIVPKEGGDRIATPSPEPSPIRERAPRVMRCPPPGTCSSSCSSATTSTGTGRSGGRGSSSSRKGTGGHRSCSRAHSQLSLTTISEEPSSRSSRSSHAEVLVQPQVVLEATCRPRLTSSSSNPGARTNSSTESSVASAILPLVTATVTARTKVKVEVHGPLTGGTECEHHHERRRREANSSQSVSGSVSSNSSSGSSSVRSSCSSSTGSMKASESEETEHAESSGSESAR